MASPKTARARSPELPGTKTHSTKALWMKALSAEEGRSVSVASWKGAVPGGPLGRCRYRRFRPIVRGVVSAVNVGGHWSVGHCAVGHWAGDTVPWSPARWGAVVRGPVRWESCAGGGWSGSARQCSAGVTLRSSLRSQGIEVRSRLRILIPAMLFVWGKVASHASRASRIVGRLVAFRPHLGPPSGRIG